MQQTLYIHIGMPKTGTTSLQFYLARHRAELAEAGILYPATMRKPAPTATQHRFLNAFLREQKRRTTGERPINYWPVNAILQEIERRALPVAFISEETLSYDPTWTAEYLARFRERIDVKILVFLRRQDLWTESLYAQSIRGGYKASFADFTRARPTVERNDFVGFLANWEKHFGEENVIVVPYVEKRTNSLDEVKRLLGDPQFEPKAVEHRNPSLSAEAIEFIRSTVNVNDIANPVFNEAFGSVLTEVTRAGRPIYFDRAARAAFLERYREVNEEIARRYLGRDPAAEPLFPIDPESFPPDEAVARPLTDERRLEILTALLDARGVDTDAPAGAPAAKIAVLQDRLVDYCTAKA